MEAPSLVMSISRVGDEALLCLLWIFLPYSVLLLTATLVYKLKQLRNNADVSLKTHVYEVHRIAGEVAASMESVKQCILLLNQFPSLVNHPMPPYCFTPFLRACWSGNTPLVRYMLKNGADLHSCTISRESPIYLAAYRVIKNEVWDPSVLNLLHEAGCELSEPNKRGCTALHLAARKGHTSLTYWLLVRGAHLTLHLSSKLKTPYQVAMTYEDLKHRSVAAILHTFSPEMVCQHPEPPKRHRDDPAEKKRQ